MANRVVGFLASIAMLGAAFVLFPAAAQAQSPCEVTAAYEGTATFGTNLTVVNAGDAIVFEGTGWPPNVTLDLAVNGEPVGSVTTDGTGAWSFTYTVPANASGTQNATVSCGSFVLSTQFSVAARATAVQTSPTTLPVTGSDSLSWVQVAVALIALGAVLVYLTKRRNQALVDS